MGLWTGTYDGLRRSPERIHAPCTCNQSSVRFVIHGHAKWPVDQSWIMSHAPTPGQCFSHNQSPSYSTVAATHEPIRG